MRVEVNSGPEARRLELDGYNRVDEKTIMAEFEQLPDLLEREDLSVQTVQLDRRNGHEEASVIDEYVRAQVPDRNKYVRHYRFDTRNTTSGRSLYKSGETILEVTEDQLVVHDHFRQAMLNGIITDHVYDRESFDKQRSKMLDALEGDIDSHKNQIMEIEDQINTLSEMVPEDV